MVRMMSVFAIALVLGTAGLYAADEAVKSGPQVGQAVPGPFHPLNINGASADKKNCLYCEYGNSPVAMVFAREATPAVMNLAKKLEAAAGKASDLNCCVIFCNDDANLPKALKEAANSANLKKVVLAVDNPAGPEDYNVAKDAEVTVVLYTGRKVASNFAFKKGTLDDKAIEKVVTGIDGILKK